MTSSRPVRLAVLATLLLVPGACGDDPTTPEISEEALVGHWTATSLVLTNDSDPSQSFDAIEQGASFFLDIQPTGDFTVGMTLMGRGLSEAGQVEVAGDLLILHVEVSQTGPRVDTATFELSDDELRLEGPTVFDFDSDGIRENGTLEATLQRDADGG